MKRALFAPAGFVMALALVVAVPGTAWAVTSDTFYINAAVNLSNYINVTQGEGGTGTISAQIPVGSFVLPGLTTAPVTSGLLTFSASLVNGAQDPNNATYQTDYTVEQAGSSLSLTGLVNGEQIGLSALLTGGTLSFTNFNSQYEVTVLSVSYSGSVGSSFTTLLGLTSTTLQGGLASLTEQGVPGSGSISGQVLLGTNPVPVPVPPAILLFAPGLLGPAALRRRFMK